MEKYEKIVELSGIMKNHYKDLQLLWNSLWGMEDVLKKERKTYLNQEIRHRYPQKYRRKK